MKIVIIGYGEMFANLVLGCLSSEHTIVGVMRNDRIMYSPLLLKIKDYLCPSKDKTFIDYHKLYDINATSVNSEKFRKILLKLNPDIILVGSWGEKLSKKTINLPKLACINCHPSLLPKYRGPNPYAQVIRNNEKKTGITFHLMDVNYDTGGIIHQAEVNVLSTDTGETLKNRCTNVAKIEIKALLQDLNTRILNVESQNEKEATYQTQLQLSDSIIDFSLETSEEIDRHIRALTPWLKCHIPYKNEFLIINNYKISGFNEDYRAGTIILKEDNMMQIVCKDNKVMQFDNLILNRPLGKYFTKFYINNYVKLFDKAL